ncbi:histidine-type phosphatase [Selenomonas ruminantium]|uniref:Glucose-1-phosphatase n=1 Tax=Selenomonas ruminantium TaxID=971 RepID=A0A1H0UDG8_SELRU|nr:histidine-type phosphatase [Selenomonas ruminantium]SDP64229.1 glucose-1-phosphatase [Selenomonas ruminantium]
MNLKKMAASICLSMLTLSSVVQAERPADFQDKYQLEEMVVLSRHNIRSPLSGNGSALGNLTPHAWFKWTSGPSELSLRGGQLETMMGQYFRQRLVKDGLMTENYLPKDGEMRFYANSMQRTIATAQYFSSGMLPVANVKIEHKYAPSKMDPVFNPQLTFVSDAFRSQAMQEISAMGGKKGLQGINDKLDSEYRTLEKTLDLKDSPMAKKEGFNRFKNDDLQILLEVNKEPAMKGSLKLANSASDAFILQYYEEPDTTKAGFGHKLTQQEWEQIASVKDVYGDVLFTAPSVAVNVAHPLLTEMNNELAQPGRKFTFLCGHDSNIASVLAALDVEEYSLPNSIEKKTPIGSKLVIEKFAGKDGKEYAAMSLVYQNPEQLRDRTALTLDTPPEIFPLKLKGIKANADGVYKLKDVQKRFEQAIQAYDKLPQDKAEKKAA